MRFIGKAALAALFGAGAAFAGGAHSGGTHSDQSNAELQKRYEKLPDGYRETVTTPGNTGSQVKVTVEQKGWKKWSQAKSDELARMRAENQSLRQQLSSLQQQQSLQGVAQVKEDARGLILTLTGGVLFQSGSAELMPDAQEKLDTVAQVLQQAPDAKFTVEGHTDSQGSAEFNKDLSERRAQAVKDYFVSKGISEGNIEAVGYGEDRAVASNDSPEGRANNRRVEVVLPEGSLGIGGSGSGQGSSSGSGDSSHKSSSGIGGSGQGSSSDSGDTGEAESLDDASPVQPLKAQ